MSQKRAVSSAHSNGQTTEPEDADIARATEQALATIAERYEKASACLQALVDEHAQTKAQTTAD